MKILQKKYYSNEIDYVIEQISFDENNVEVMGTAGKKGFLYPADFDLYEIVSRTNINKIVSVFKKIIKRIINNPFLFISDIKCGEIQEWKIIDDNARIDNKGKLKNYNYKQIVSKLIVLKKKNIITKKEYDDSLFILKKQPNRVELETIKKDIRFHILRWKPQDILNGCIIYRNKKIFFKDALQSPSLFKLDVIALIMSDMRFIEFNIIYDIRVNNIRQNSKRINPEITLKNDILYYKEKQDYFKMLKRYFSLVNYKIKYKKQDSKENQQIYKTIFDILNSELGILYQVTQDIETIIILLEDKMYLGNKIDFVVDGFIDRLSTIYSLNSFLKNEDKIMREIYSNVQKQDLDSLKNINYQLYNILNKETNKIISKYNILQL